jgi:hypothetical protein
MKDMLKLSKCKDEENINCKRQVVATSCKLIGCENPF